jgi:hypothetical protein
MTLLRQWVLGVAGAAVFCAMAQELTPKGRVKSVQRLLCGIVMALALVRPLLELDFESYSISLAEYRRDTAELSTRAEEISDSLSRTLIQEKCAAYILDKAAQLGLKVTSAEVELHWSGEGVWYPTAAEISGEYDERLSRLIETELGISRDRQKWSEK